jgi:GR25 family glycosyltransferase involved in LPS biosynthesis
MDLIDKIFFINLDERIERRDHFLNECAKQNIPDTKIERFSAINGKTHLFTNEELQLFNNTDFYNNLTPLIVKKKLMGNQLSHINILLEMKRRNYNNIIIFQDDAVLKNNFIYYIDEIMQDIPDNAEIINIGMHKTAINEYFEPYDLTTEIEDDNLIDKKITNFVYSYKIWYSETTRRVNPASLAFIVTKKGCYNLLDFFYKNGGIQRATDWNYNLYLQSKNIFYGSKYVLATGNNSFRSDVFVNTDEYLLEDLIDTNVYYTDKNTTHSYFTLYNELFNPIREQCKNILEIGIGNFHYKNGGSLILWKMFFKNAMIHGVDIISENMVYDIILKDDNIKTYTNSNAYDTNFIEKFREKNLLFDIIIDDGPHTLETQCKCIELYCDLLSENGILVIEDVQDISWTEKFKQSTPSHLKKYIHVYDRRHIKNRYDDIVFVINKNITNKLYDLNNIDIPLVISYENDNRNKNSNIFKKTLETKDWQYLFIGEGTKWNGFGDKIIGYYNELQKLTDDKIVVLSDSRDVFCLKNSEFFISSVKNIIDKQIIISSEMFLRGHMDWSDKQISNAISTHSDFFWQGVPLDNYWVFCNKQNNLPLRKYLNSGLIVGKVHLLKDAFKWIIENSFSDDQLGFCKFTNKFPELVYLDYDAQFLHTSTGFVNGSLYNHTIQVNDLPSFVELFGLSSYFLHIPGLKHSKGQEYIYNTIYKLFDGNALEKDMYNVYNIKGNFDNRIFMINDF